MLDLLLSTIIWVTIGGNFFLGLLVLSRNPKKIINAVFFLMAFSTALWAMSLFFYQHPVWLDSENWLRIVYFIVAMPLLFSLFLFSFVFPKKSTKSLTLPVVFYFVTSSFFAYLIFFTEFFLVSVTLQPGGSHQLLGPLYPVFGIWASFVAGWALYYFFRSYKKAQGVEKTQLRFLFVGL